MTKIHRSVSLTDNPNCDIIRAIVIEIQKHRDIIERLRPLKLTVHIPPKDSRDPAALEITAKLKDE